MCVCVIVCFKHFACVCVCILTHVLHMYEGQRKLGGIGIRALPLHRPPPSHVGSGNSDQQAWQQMFYLLKHLTTYLHFV